jgi:hypothetical protein
MSTNNTSNTSASRVMRGIKDSVSGQVEAQKHRAAEGIGGMADGVRRLSDELRGHNAQLANLVGSAGSRLDGLATKLRDSDPAVLAQEVARFARQRPALFVGAAFVAVLGVSQLLRTAALADGSSSSSGQDRASASLGDELESSVGA